MAKFYTGEGSEPLCKRPRFAKPGLSLRSKKMRSLEMVLLEGWMKSRDNAYHATDNPQGIVCMGVSQNKVVYDVLEERLNRPDSQRLDESMTHYCDLIGTHWFRTALASFLTERAKAHSPIHPDDIMVLNGCGSVVDCLSQIVCDVGEAILVPAPFYNGFDADIRARAFAVPYPVHLSDNAVEEHKAFEITTSGLEQALMSAQQEGLIVRALLVHNPNNPLGVIHSRTELQCCLDFCHKNGLHCIVDEIYMLSVFDCSQTFESVLSFEHIPDQDSLHVIWGFSKDFAVSGFRCGCLISSNSEIKETVSKLSSFYSTSPTVQARLCTLIQDKDWLDSTYLPALWTRLQASHQYVCTSLEEMGVPFVRGCSGFFIWANFSKCLPRWTKEREKALWLFFLNEGIYINPGSAFYSKEFGWFRIIFSRPLEVLSVGMDRLKRAVYRVCHDQSLQDQLCSPSAKDA